MGFHRFISFRNVYFAGMLLLAAGIPLSKFLMSISQMILMVNWLIEGGIAAKMRAFLSNKIALFIVSLYLIHLAGLIYTSNFEYALNDLRIKLPLLILPLILSSTQPLGEKRFNCLIITFIVSVFCGTLASYGEMLGINNTFREWIGKPLHIINNPRDYSLFISMIRFGLMICLAIVCTAYLAVKQFKTKTNHDILSYPFIKNSLLFPFIFYLFPFIFIILWLLIALIVLESISGISILLILSLVSAIVFISTHKNFVVKSVITLALVASTAAVSFYISAIINEVRPAAAAASNPLELMTKAGSPYSHDTTNKQMVNGNFVWRYINWGEIASGWSARSKTGFEDEDARGVPVKYTLIQFLTSKGLRKDAEGVGALNAEEISAIEKGVTNAKHIRISGINLRIHEIATEWYNYTHAGIVNFSSVAQRIEYWKAAIAIISSHPLLGVGTGDADIAFQQHYEKTNSSLLPQCRNRSHNQFLAAGVAFGIPVMVWFIFVLLSPLFFKRIKKDKLFLLFLLIAVLSMLTEDTLETQAGVTFVSFFYCILLFRNR